MSLPPGTYILPAGAVEWIEGPNGEPLARIDISQAVPEEAGEPRDREPIKITQAMVQEASEKANARRSGLMERTLKQLAWEWRNEDISSDELIQKAVNSYVGSRNAWIARGRPTKRTRT